MIRHQCWRCHKVETASVEWRFCPRCGAPFQERHKMNTQNMPIVDDDYVKGYRAWREKSPATDIISILTIEDDDDNQVQTAVAGG